jgi:murein DD-endopeptidase MepM/ murein hydrolase activator NlpD
MRPAPSPSCQRQSSRSRLAPWVCAVSRPWTRAEGTSGLDQGRRRGALRSNWEAERIDLGNEPPLSVDGENTGLVDRHRISVQWFSGTILAGLCGAALMSGAVFAALDGETNLATVPERVEANLRGAAGAVIDRIANTTRKADRLPPPGEANAARQVIRVSTTTRGSGNREIVRVRPFIRVAGNLSLSVSELSANIPPFNAQKIIARSEGIPVNAEDAAGAEPDAEVSFITRDLAAALPRAKIAAVASLEEVLARVREAANWDGSSAQRPALLASAIPSVLTAYAPERHGDPYAGFEPRIVPENVTLLPKTKAQVTGGNAWNERTVPLKKGDSVSAVLREMGATADELKAITTAFGGRGKDSSPRDGYKLRVLLAPASDGSRLRPVRVIIATETNIEAMVAWSEMGKYVAVDVRSANSVASSANDDDDDDGKSVRLYQSIYETALRNHVPRPVIDDLIRIYSYDVDFQRKVQPGDTFEILYAGEDENVSDNSKAEVLFALLTTGGETRKFYRYQTTDDNVVDYYDESGKSAKKFLVRKPVSDGNITSGFGGRNHPLLGYSKMHTGVDWGSSTGTAIFAAGNGMIDKVGWEGGYGKYIRIRHANGYETAYGHMSAFARGMEQGKKVRQGQVIGYVGSTGLSTGAHLHYEILINGRFVDPMKIRLPRGRVLEGTLLAGFDQERSRLDALMTRAVPSRYAQTK